MCYAIPGRVESINNKTATIRYFNETKQAVNELTALSVGDYVYAQGGYVIERLTAQEAVQIIDTWKELFEQLKEIDVSLSKKQIPGSNKELNRILDKASSGNVLSQQECLYILSMQEQTEINQIIKTANFLRQKYHSNASCVHGIIEISNQCNAQCGYCGISAGNKHISRYRMSKDEIVSVASRAVKEFGFKALILQSGQASGYSLKELKDIIKEIKRAVPVLIGISFGEVSRKGLQDLFDAGARLLLMRFETSNAQLYQDMHPDGRTLATRIDHLEYAHTLGYTIITGSLIGIPNQTQNDIINDIKLADKLNASMFSFGPFLPHPHTPMALISAPQENEVFKVLALARFIAKPKANILVTTAFETLSHNARSQGLCSGANSLMLNVTPVVYRKQYSIYPHRAHETESLAFQVKEAQNLLSSIGRVPMDLGAG